MNGVPSNHHVFLAAALVEADRRRADQWRRRRSHERPEEPEMPSEGAPTEGRLARIAARLRLRRLILGGV